MRLVGQALLAVLALIAAPQLAAAQPQQPLIPEWPQTRLAERDPGTRGLYIIAVCIEHERRDRAIALLATPPGSFAQAPQLERTVPSSTDCPIGEWVRIPLADLMRGAIAEAIYNGDRTRPRGDVALPLTETFETWRARETARGARFATGRDVGRWTAHCAVHRAPRLTHELLSQIPGSQRERAALNALRQTFTGCLPADERLTMPRLMMRTLIAEELYHAVGANRAAFVSGR